MDIDSRYRHQLHRNTAYLSECLPEGVILLTWILFLLERNTKLVQNIYQLTSGISTFNLTYFWQHIMLNHFSSHLISLPFLHITTLSVLISQCTAIANSLDFSCKKNNSNKRCTYCILVEFNNDNLLWKYWACWFRNTRSSCTELICEMLPYVCRKTVSLHKIFFPDSLGPRQNIPPRRKKGTAQPSAGQQDNMENSFTWPAVKSSFSAPLLHALTVPNLLNLLPER